jgi:hypothetical protein
MARTVRIEYEGAVYHVMCRGDRGESVFPSEGDRETFLDTLAEACERTGFEIHSRVGNAPMEQLSGVCAVPAYRPPTDRARKALKNKMTICSD